jgi:hypothetical protein
MHTPADKLSGRIALGFCAVNLKGRKRFFLKKEAKTFINRGRDLLSQQNPALSRLPCSGVATPGLCPLLGHQP